MKINKKIVMPGMRQKVTFIKLKITAFGWNIYADSWTPFVDENVQAIIQDQINVKCVCQEQAKVKSVDHIYFYSHCKVSGNPDMVLCTSYSTWILCSCSTLWL